MANNTPTAKVLIVDDDALSRQLIRDGLKKYDWAEVCGETTGISDTLALAAELKPDLVFLDIELNDRSAIDVIPDIKKLLAPESKIVFYTTYSKYLMQALRLEAFDFLLKPFDPAELDLIMNRYRLNISASPRCASAHIDRLDAAPGSRTHAGLSVTTITNDRIILFPKDIVFFRYDTDRKIWEVVLGTLQHLILKRNTTAETILNYGPQFVRTHKSYIVNIGFISMISGNVCRLIPPYDTLSDIKISKVYRPQLLNMFYDL